MFMFWAQRLAHDTNFMMAFSFQGDVSSDYSPNKVPHSKIKSVSPSADRRSLSQQRSTASTGKLAKYQMPRYPEEPSSRRSASLKQTPQRSSIPYVDHLTGDKKLDNILYGKIRHDSIIMQWNSYERSTLFFSLQKKKFQLDLVHHQ